MSEVPRRVGTAGRGRPTAPIRGTADRQVPCPTLLVQSAKICVFHARLLISWGSMGYTGRISVANPSVSGANRCSLLEHLCSTEVFSGSLWCPSVVLRLFEGRTGEAVASFSSLASTKNVSSGVVRRGARSWSCSSYLSNRGQGHSPAGQPTGGRASVADRLPEVRRTGPRAARPYGGRTDRDDRLPQRSRWRSLRRGLYRTLPYAAAMVSEAAERAQRVSDGRIDLARRTWSERSERNGWYSR